MIVLPCLPIAIITSSAHVHGVKLDVSTFDGDILHCRVSGSNSVLLSMTAHITPMQRSLSTYDIL